MHNIYVPITGMIDAIVNQAEAQGMTAVIPLKKIGKSSGCMIMKYTK